MKTMKSKARIVALLGMVLSAFPVLAALYFQHKDGLHPCHLCMFQRVAFIVCFSVFSIVLLHGPTRAFSRWMYATTLVIFAAVGMTSAIRQIWLQHLPPDQVPSCGASLDMMLEMLPLSQVVTRVFRGTGECAVVDWTFLGLSMAWWSLGFLVVLAILSLTLARIRA